MSKKQADKANKVKVDAAIDSPVTEEQAAEIKGGAETNRPIRQFEIKDFSFGVENPTTIG